MRKCDLEAAMAIAQGDEDLTNEDIGLFNGFALPDFEPVACTLRALARLIRWQCIQFNGGVYQVELNTIWACRRRFLVVG